MRKIYLFFIVLLTMPTVAAADLSVALQDVRTACGGISDELSDLKKMTGINTAVTGVGTAAGAGATAVGVVKSQRDKDIEYLEKYVADLQRMQAASTKSPDSLSISDGDIDASVRAARQRVVVASAQTLESIDDAEKQIDELTEKSKNLGNWRTGLLATNTVTNVAGAVIAGGNKVDVDLNEKITGCIAAVNNLRDAYGAARIERSAYTEILSGVQQIIAECGAWQTADLSPINKRAQGATIAASVGAGVGLTGTIVSALANSKPVRDGDDKKEKNLNTASNVMAGGATVASGVAVVFNATQIGAVKRIIDIADKCEEVLR